MNELQAVKKQFFRINKTANYIQIILAANVPRGLLDVIVTRILMSVAILMGMSFISNVVIMVIA